MTPFRFVHAADLHLDSPFEGLGRVTPQVADRLRDASLDAWDALVRLSIDEKAEFLIVAGDIYDGEERGVRAQLRFLRGLETLSVNHVDVFLAHGNHDPAGGRWSAIREWPAGVTVFGHERVESSLVRRDGVALAAVHGISHASRAVSENLALRFRRGPEACPHIGVLHCNADGDTEHPMYSPCTPDDLRAAGMDYWALGHIHAYRVVASGDCNAVYAGALQGRSLKPSERGPKGAVVGTIDNGTLTGWRFAPVSNLRFVEFPIDVAGIADLGRLAARLEEAAGAELASGATGLVLRARLTGRGPVHADLRAADAVDEFLRRMREEAATHEPFAWWSAISDETRQDLDLDAIRARGDFSSELLRLSDGLRADDTALRSFVNAGIGELWTPQIEKATRAPETDAAAVLEDAAMLALGKLEEGNGQ